MTDSIEYWKHYSRIHEERARTNYNRAEAWSEALRRTLHGLENERLTVEEAIRTIRYYVRKAEPLKKELPPPYITE